MEKIQITIEQGTLEGKTLKTDNNFEYDAFLAIPYAKPPLGALRFREPEPAEGWSGIRDATEVANVAPQFDVLFKKQYVGDEDCLYLNIFVPHGVVTELNLPVMFWIHGGGFNSGSGNPNFYGPDLLIPNGVVIVTINYRLGPLGFMCLNTPDCPGNVGLKDQLMALKWVKNNIKQFGGNPQNITVFGESAGGASAHHLVLTPLAKGLIHKGIIQSGTSINEWASQDQSEHIAFKLGEMLCFQTKDKNELLNFLREVPSKILIMTSISPNLTEGTLIGFTPVIEKEFPETKAFMTKDPRKAMRDGDFNKIPTISGFTSKEGILILIMKIQEIEKVQYLTLEELVPDFKAYIPKALQGMLNNEQRHNVAKKIKEFYFPTAENIVENFIDLESDYSFIKDIHLSTKLLSTYTSATYCYKFSYNGALNITKHLSSIPYTGASHADELGYIFKQDLKQLNLNVVDNLKPTEKDKLMIRRMTELWTNFAKYGNPTPAPSEAINIVWEPTSKNDTICLDIDEKLSLVKNPFEERMKFWNKLETSA